MKKNFPYDFMIRVYLTFFVSCQKCVLNNLAVGKRFWNCIFVVGNNHHCYKLLFFFFSIFRVDLD